MPRVAIPITPVTVAGIAPPVQVAGNPGEDHVIDPGADGVLLEAQNIGSTEGRVVTIRTPRKVDGVDVAEVEITVPKESTRLIRVEAGETFRQEDGKVYIDVASAELKFRAYRV